MYLSVCLRPAVTGCVWTQLTLSSLMEPIDVISPTLTQPSAVSHLLLHLNTPVRLVADDSTHLAERYGRSLQEHINNDGEHSGSSLIVCFVHQKTYREQLPVVFSLVQHLLKQNQTINKWHDRHVSL